MYTILNRAGKDLFFMTYILICSFSFVLTMLPPVYLRYLPFQKILQPVQKKRLKTGYAVISLVEVAVLAILTQAGLIAFNWISFKILISVCWLPYFFLNVLLIRQHLAQHIFILGMQSIYTITIHTLAVNVLFLLLPDACDFFDYLLPYLFLYIALFFLCMPIIRDFFIEIFVHYRAVQKQYFWKQSCLLPFLLILNHSFFWINPLQLAREHLFPRLCMALCALIFGKCVLIGLRELDARLTLYKNNYDLNAQINAFTQYVDALRNAEKKLALFRHDSRHQLHILAAMIEEKKNDEALMLIHKLNEEIEQTKIRQFCRNTMVNAALSVYIRKAEDAGIPVQWQLDIPSPPHHTQTTVDAGLAIVLSNLMENALYASLQQPAGRRKIELAARHTHGTLMFMIKNRYDGTVQFDVRGLPVTNRQGHGLGMKSLEQFRKKTDATVLCTHEDGWFSVYLQFDIEKNIRLL